MEHRFYLDRLKKYYIEKGYFAYLEKDHNTDSFWELMNEKCSNCCTGHQEILIENSSMEEIISGSC